MQRHRRTEERMRNPYQRWQEYQPSKEQVLWIAIGSVVVTLVAGFGLGGWVTGGTAQQRADEAARTSFQTLAAAVCKENFLRAADASERLAKLQSADWWQRDELVAKAGWATMPGEDEADSAVASQCATHLTEYADAQAKNAPLAASAR
jgi:hypothetical protein